MKHKIVILFLLVIFSFLSCEKDYPKDIPEWLEDKIKEIRKEIVKNEISPYVQAVIISEYQLNDEIIYYYLIGSDIYTEYFYNYDGSLLCNMQRGQPYKFEDAYCDDFYIGDLVFIRFIYRAFPE